MQFLLMDTTLTRLVAVMIWSKNSSMLKRLSSVKIYKFTLTFQAVFYAPLQL